MQEVTGLSQQNNLTDFFIKTYVHKSIIKTVEAEGTLIERDLV